MSDTAIVGLIAALPPTILALAALITAVLNGLQQKKIAKKVDGRMTQLLKVAKKEALRKGIEEGEHRPRRPPPKKRR